MYLLDCAALVEKVLVSFYFVKAKKQKKKRQKNKRLKSPNLTEQV